MLFLSNNTLHVMFSTYICYWNTIQYKYIQITFHVVKQYHARVFSKDIWLLFIMLFICLFLSLFVYQFTLSGWFFLWAPSQKFIIWEKCVTLAILGKTPRKIDKYFSFTESNLCKNSFTLLKHFVWFHWKITGHLGKSNKKVIRLTESDIELTHA